MMEIVLNIMKVFLVIVGLCIGLGVFVLLGIAVEHFVLSRAKYEVLMFRIALLRQWWKNRKLKPGRPTYIDDFRLTGVSLSSRDVTSNGRRYVGIAGNMPGEVILSGTISGNAALSTDIPPVVITPAKLDANFEPLLGKMSDETLEKLHTLVIKERRKRMDSIPSADGGLILPGV